MRLQSVMLCALLSAFTFTAGCSKDRSRRASAPQPPTPAMPAGWKVTADVLIPPAHIGPIEKTLSGAIVALRNTTFAVGGHTVKVNTIIAKDAANAAKLMDGLRKIKSDDYLLRRGTTIYEFVGKNAAMEMMKKGRAHLKR